MNILFPHKCPGCMKVVERRGLCSHCAPLVIFVTNDTCKKCGRQKEFCVCDENKLIPEFDLAVAVFYYEGVIREAVKNLKFHKSENAGRFLSEGLIRRFDEVFNRENFDMIIAVLDHKITKRKNGFSHIEYLSSNLSRTTGIPESRALKKVVNNQKQHNLGTLFRSGNVAGVYEVKKEKVSGKRILLIDDVLTTGNTSNECAKILKIRGAKEVTVLVCAATLPLDRKEIENLESDEI